MFTLLFDVFSLVARLVVTSVAFAFNASAVFTSAVFAFNASAVFVASADKS